MLRPCGTEEGGAFQRQKSSQKARDQKHYCEGRSVVLWRFVGRKAWMVEEMARAAREQGTQAERTHQAYGLLRKAVLVLSLFVCVMGGMGKSAQAADEDAVAKTTNFSLSGYFRFRGDVFNNFGLGVAPRAEANSPVSAGRPRFGFFPFYHPISAYPASENSLRQSYTKDNLPSWLSGGNMRLRVLATLNVSDFVQVFSTFDFLDNVVMGSTSRGNQGLMVDPMMPLLALSETQVPPNVSNSFMESLRVRHIFASIQLPFATLVAGRMPNEWGLGMMANSGMRLNSDFGDSMDRVALIVPLFGHLIIPSYEFMASGPTSERNGQWRWGQPFNLEQGDDVHQVTLRLARIDRGQQLRRKIDNGEWIVNYGLHFSYRWQQLSSECFAGTTCVNTQLQPAETPNGLGRSPHQIALQQRGLSLFIPDVWFRLQLGSQFRIELEWAFMIGAMEVGIDGTPVDIFQWGGVLQFEYSLLNGSLLLGLDLGIASGDKDFVSRWGRPVFDSEAATSPDRRGKLNNFLFNPDYQVDMILFRELFGTVTNAYYIRPHITYNVFGDAWKEDGFGVRLTGIFSGALVPEATLGQHPLLGAELNAMVRYASSDGYVLMVSYGVLFPLPGMSFAELDSAGNRNELLPASIAHRIHVSVNVRF
jgi:uncharacterized protein (TIGR04551 family)